MPTDAMRFRTLLRIGVTVCVAVCLGASGVHAQQAVFVRTGSPAWLGVSYDVRWVQDDGRCDPEVMVDQVVQGSPAERAGLRAGDIIMALNGRPVPAASLQAVAGRLNAGDSVQLRVRRGGRIHELRAVAALRPDRPPSILGGGGAGVAWSTSAPVVRVEGDRLVVRNIEEVGRNVRGYWLSTGDDGTEYRRIGSRSRDGLDERVVRLLRCVAETDRHRAVAPLDVRQIQRRADSLRVVITRRALQSARAAPEPPTPPEVAALRAAEARARLTPPAPPAEAPAPRSFALRLEDHVMAGLRGVAGAEITALEPELASYFRNATGGLLVLRVAPDTPAHRAGLRPGDVIVQGNGRRLESVGELRALVSSRDRHPVELRLVRQGRSRTLTLDRP